MKHFVFLHRFLVAILFFSGTFIARAQEYSESIDSLKKEQTFRFVYIAPDRAVDKRALTADLKVLYDNMLRDESPTIFYLANGKKPIIVEFNTGANNQDDYETKLMYQINTNTSWTVDISDRTNIREILLRQNIIDAQGQLIYGRTEIYYLVGREFWEGRKNESIIGALYFDLDAARYKGNDALFQYNVYFYCPPAQDNCSSEHPFGKLNPDGINEEIKVRRRQNL